VDVMKGLKKNGIILINSTERPEKFRFEGMNISTVDATGIALNHKLGSTMAPIVNTAILGAYIRAMEKFSMEKIKMDSLISAIEENVPAKPKENVESAKEAYEKILI
jgi:Pyruvate/2-oxoacid:ferredoxin oxidoreductase gamma subunit